MNFQSILVAARQVYASDVHLRCGDAVVARVAGHLQTLNVPPLETNALNEWLLSIMDDSQKVAWHAGQQLDFAMMSEDGERVRLSVYQTLGAYGRSTAVAVRLLNATPPSLAQLGAPEFLNAVTPFRQGLVLITGPTGSGKSTTLASWLHHVNQKYPAHIITLEDPIEYVVDSDVALVHQSEVPRKENAYSDVLRNVLRRDPDAIVLGELRDLASIQLALRAAETGHLVIATLHSSNATEAIARLIDVFPAESKSFVRHVLASILLGVVAQKLVRCNEGVNKQGRIANYEVLTGSVAVKNLIKEEKEMQLPAVMQSGAAHQMFTFEQHYQKLSEARLVNGGSMGSFGGHG